MTVFSFSGAYANISYTDIMGKVILPEKRKKLLVVKQLISSVGVIVSALLVKVILSRVSYPANYSLLFILAGLLLLLGTIGFWMILEPAAPAPIRTPLHEKYREFWKVLKEDPNFRKYLFLINTSGVIVSTLPFLLLYGKSRFTVDGGMTAP
jgi:Na+/melibiose symporter-like transporter